jgi:hypothetical protein
MIDVKVFVVVIDGVDLFVDAGVDRLILFP